MGLVEQIKDKFRYQPLRVKFAAGFLTLFVFAIIGLILTAAVADLGFLGALAVFGGIGAFVLLFWSIITIASSDL